MTIGLNKRLAGRATAAAGPGSIDSMLGLPDYPQASSQRPMMAEPFK
jgi:hypothetical protein